jgi:hypothetical protein
MQYKQGMFSHLGIMRAHNPTCSRVFNFLNVLSIPRDLVGEDKFDFGCYWGSKGGTLPEGRIVDAHFANLDNDIPNLVDDGKSDCYIKFKGGVPTVFDLCESDSIDVLYKFTTNSEFALTGSVFKMSNCNMFFEKHINQDREFSFEAFLLGAYFHDYVPGDIVTMIRKALRVMNYDLWNDVAEDYSHLKSCVAEERCHAMAKKGKSEASNAYAYVQHKMLAFSRSLCTEWLLYGAAYYQIILLDFHLVSKDAFISLQHLRSFTFKEYELFCRNIHYF